MRISEVFLSLQGESSSAGLPTVFVRTTGCNLRCRWCDTAHAFTGGEEMSPEEVRRRVDACGVRRVCLTGGEPLLQPRGEVAALLDLLADHEVSVETSGALPLAPYTLREHHRWVMDVKCPSSGMADRMDRDNLRRLRPQDEVKFVVADEADYRWAAAFIRRHGLDGRHRLLLSPVHGELDPAALAAWMLEDRLEARLQVQLHKLLWGDARGR